VKCSVCRQSPHHIPEADANCWPVLVLVPVLELVVMAYTTGSVSDSTCTRTVLLVLVLPTGSREKKLTPSTGISTQVTNPLESECR
jgi:hypothetical protein